MTEGPARRVAILADDLIWSVRLAELVRQSDAEPIQLRDVSQLRSGLAVPPAALVVDLTSRGYDPLEGCRLAASAGIPVLAIGQHDDRAGRASALAAGAERVVPYRLMAQDGAAVLALFLATDRDPDHLRAIDEEPTP